MLMVFNAMFIQELFVRETDRHRCSLYLPKADIFLVVLAMTFNRATSSCVDI
jgi:hypothetical protein